MTHQCDCPPHRRSAMFGKLPIATKSLYREGDRSGPLADLSNCSNVRGLLDDRISKGPSSPCSAMSSLDAIGQTVVHALAGQSCERDKYSRLICARGGSFIHGDGATKCPLPTTLVGSYAQPEWLIDRKKLAGRFPPRVRARELWRVAPDWSGSRPGPCHHPRHPRPGARWPRHHHRR